MAAGRLAPSSANLAFFCVVESTSNFKDDPEGRYVKSLKGHKTNCALLTS